MANEKVYAYRNAGTENSPLWEKYFNRTIADAVQMGADDPTTIKEYVDNRLNLLSDEKMSSPTTATIGQVIAVKSIDDLGVPDEYEAVDLPNNEKFIVTFSGQGTTNSPYICDKTMNDITNAYKNGQDISALFIGATLNGDTYSNLILSLTCIDIGAYIEFSSDLLINNLQRIVAYIDGTEYCDVYVDSALDDTLALANRAANSKAVGDKLDQFSDEKVTIPSTGSIEQILAVKSVDVNGKPNEFKCVDKPTAGDSNAIQEYWGDFESNETNTAMDITNSTIMDNYTHEVGTSGTLRHNAVWAAAKNAVGMIYVESTGNIDYAESTGQTTVYVQLFKDRFGNGINNPPGTLQSGTAVEVFPKGSEVIGLDGNLIGTVIATSDASLAFISEDEIIILSECVLNDGNSYKIYRKGTVSDLTVTFDESENPIGLLTIDGAIWDVKNIDESYISSSGQLNTNIDYINQVAYIAIVVNNTAVCVLKSTDFIDWTCVNKISDENVHLEASIKHISYVGKDYPTIFIAARNKYGLGYISLYSLKHISDTSPKLVKIPASSSRPQFVVMRNCYGYYSPETPIYLCYTINGRKTAVVTKIESGTDGTTGVRILTTPSGLMSNYPCGVIYSNGLWFAGTNGLQTDKNGISWVELSYGKESTESYNRNLNDTMHNGGSVIVTQKLTSGTEIGSVTIGESETKLYAPSNGSINTILDITITEDQYVIPILFDSAKKFSKLLAYVECVGSTANESAGSICLSEYKSTYTESTYYGNGICMSLNDSVQITATKKYVYFEVNLTPSGSFGKSGTQSGNSGGWYSAITQSFVAKYTNSYNFDGLCIAMTNTSKVIGAGTRVIICGA